VPAVLVEDFSLDSNLTLPGFDSSGAFLHTGSGVEIQSVASAPGAPISLPHVLSVFRVDNMTFPGQTVNFASVAANTAFGGGRVEFVGTLGTICYLSPGFPPPPSGTATVNPNGIGLQAPGNPAWVIVGTDPTVTGINIGQITEVRLSGGEIRFDDVTIDTGPPPTQFPPDAVDDSADGFVNTPVSIPVLANDSDPDGDPLTVTPGSLPISGTVELNDNGTPADPTDDFFVYTPLTNFVGTVTFTYSVDDGHGNVDHATVTVTIRQAGHVPDPCDPAQTAFQIMGTSADDVVRFAPEFIGSGHTVVLLNNTVVGRFLSASRVIFYGFEGDDDIGITNFPALYFGGPGNDIMTGGNQADVLVGGPGNDILLGRQGNDVLIGGTGFDLLFGGLGEDILIGGTTDHDDAPQALCTISDEWAGPGTRAARISNLTAGIGPGDIRLTSSTIHNDAMIDILAGGPANDWFPNLFFLDFPL
jgi:Ca2+-binding RTX toxin-like protein